jgi:asparaginyl-tRNA synthetase
MIEPEIAFAGIDENIELIEELVKYVIEAIFSKCKEELDFCDENLETGLIAKLNNVRSSKFKINTYAEIIEILKAAIANGHNFEENNVEFGLDLGTEHERYICEVVNNSPTFVINYPKEIKAFYMKQNDDGKTVAAVDLLVPGIGELVGGSQREDDFAKLIKRCEEMNINTDELS